MNKYYFTFGSNHEDKKGNSLGNAFVVIEASDEFKARAKMTAARGYFWAFSYPEKQFGDQEKRYGLVKKQLDEVSIV